MIHYNIWFSFRDGADESGGLQRVRFFLADLKAHETIQDFTLLRNRAAPGTTKLPAFQALVVFNDDDQFTRSFKDVAAIGVHSGGHGLMIEQVLPEFTAEVFDVVEEGGPSKG